MNAFRSLLAAALLPVPLFSFSFTGPDGSEGRVDPDFAVAVTMDVTVKEKDDGVYTAVMKRTNRFTYCSERSVEVDRFSIDESSVAPLSNLQATFNKRGLAKERFSFRTAPSKDVFLSGAKIHSIVIPVGREKGDVFSYSYQEEYRDMAFLPPLYIRSNDSLAVFVVRYRLPQEAEIDFRFFFSRDSFPVTVTRDEDDVVTVSAGPLPEMHDVPFFPYNGLHAVVLPRIRKGAREITVTSERGLAEWYARYTPLAPLLDSSDRPAAMKLIGTSGTPLERVRSVAEYIRNNVRYIADERGINAYIARSPSRTFAVKYGDCKDKAALGVALGTLAGVPVHMALISTEPKPPIPGANVYLFDHAVCVYELEGRTYFFDPTASHVEFGNVPQRLIGARALVLDPDNPRYETVAAANASPSLEIAVDAHLDSLSAASAVIVLRNDMLATARHALKELTAERWKQYLHEVIGSNLFQLKLNDFRFVAEDERSMTVRGSADLSKFTVRSSGRFYIPQTPFTGSFGEVVQREKDSLPLAFPVQTRLLLTINLRAPGAAVDTTRPLAIGAAGGPWFYAARSSQREDRIAFRYEFVNEEKYFGRDAKNEFMPFIRQYLSNRNKRFIITRPS